MSILQDRKFVVYPEGQVTGQEYPLEHIGIGEKLLLLNNAAVLFAYAVDLGLKVLVAVPTQS